MSEVIAEPSQEVIDNWKKQYQNVYKIDLAGMTFLYRGLMRVEYRSLTRTIQPNPMGNPADEALQIEEKMVGMGTLYPKIDDGNMPATLTGVITRLAELIMEASGYDIEAEPEML